MRKLIVVLFYLISSFSIQATQNDNFHLCIKSCRAKSIVTQTLITPQVQAPEEHITHFTLNTKSNIAVPVTFYDRGSDVLMVAAQALPSSKESMHVFAKMFSNYDVILFDYRWCNQYEKLLAKSIFMANPVQRILLDEIEELATVVQCALKRKNYQTVVGLGECYSCFLLAKLQSDAIKQTGTGPFTHLILDSTWYSLRDFAKQICCDPFLPLWPQDGGAPRIIKWLTDNRLFKHIVLHLVFTCMTNISIEPYIATVGIPVLFVHGRNDLFVPQKHFKKIWHVTDKENRAALLTPFRHSDNLKSKARTA